MFDSNDNVTLACNGASFPLTSNVSSSSLSLQAGATIIQLFSQLDGIYTLTVVRAAPDIANIDIT